jgi:hypothetical protein
MNDDLFNEAQMVRGLEVDSMRVMGLFAKEHTNEQGRMKVKDRAAIRAAWDCDPLPYARAANMFPEWFSGRVDVGKWEMLSLLKIASISDKFKRLDELKEWQSKTLSFDDVRARVDGLKPKRAKKPNELHKVILALLDYRRRNTTNFQLEKLDDYLHELRRLVDP